MVDVFKGLSRLGWGLLKAVLWVFTAGLALLLLGLALCVLLLGVVWSLLRGRKPSAPVFVGRVRRFTADTVWRGQSGAAAPQPTEVVDVEVREVPEAPPPGLKRPDAP